MKEKETELIEEKIETNEEKAVQGEEKIQEEMVEETQEEITQKEPEVTILEQEKEDIEIETQTQQEENQTAEKPKKKRMDGLHRYTKVVAIVSILLVLAAMFFSTIFAFVNKSRDDIVEGVFVKGINVGGLTREEATNQLNETFNQQLKKDIRLKHGEFETSVTPEQIEMNFNISEAVDLAYCIGRTGSILKDNYDILNAKIANLEINPAYSYQDELLTNFIVSTEGNLPDIVKQSGYSIDGSNLIIDKGQKGFAIDKELLKKQIVDASVNFRARKYNN